MVKRGHSNGSPRANFCMRERTRLGQARAHWDKVLLSTGQANRGLAHPTPYSLPLPLHFRM